MPDRGGSLERFSGFADLYDAVRPSPPAALGPLLAGYAGVDRPRVVDLGSGTGHSSRWASGWAASVLGVEPNDDMRAVAERRPAPGVRYRKAVAADTGLPSGSADAVLAVQAMHWMAPGPTLAEVARLLRPGGVLALVDCDRAPVTGSARAERAWATMAHRLDVLERRAAQGQEGARLRRPVEEPAGTAAVAGDAGADRDRDRVGGVRSWGKQGHLARLASCGHFAFARELALYEAAGGAAERFVGLLRSQSAYQHLARLGLTDAELGMDRFEAEVAAAFAAAPVPPVLGFTWRVRLGVTPA